MALGRAARLHPAGDRRPAARARRLRPPVRGQPADHACPSSSTRCCRASTRSRSAPTSSSAAPTRRSTTWSAGSCSARAGQAPQAVLTVPLLVGTDGVEKMGKSLGNYIAIDEPAAEQFGKLMSIPDAVVGHVRPAVHALHPREVDELEAEVAAGGGAANRAKRRDGPRGRALYHGAEAAGGRGALRRRVQARRGADGRAGARAARRRPGAPAGRCWSRRAGAEHQRGPARHRRRRGPDRRRASSRRARYDLPAAELAGAVLAVGKRRVARLVEPPEPAPQRHGDQPQLRA